MYTRMLIEPRGYKYVSDVLTSWYLMTYNNMFVEAKFSELTCILSIIYHSVLVFHGIFQ